MGMFSMSEGREIGEVNELGDHKRQEPGSLPELAPMGVGGPMSKERFQSVIKAMLGGQTLEELGEEVRAVSK